MSLSWTNIDLSLQNLARVLDSNQLLTQSTSFTDWRITHYTANN